MNQIFSIFHTNKKKVNHSPTRSVFVRDPSLYSCAGYLNLQKDENTLNKFRASKAL